LPEIYLEISFNDAPSNAIPCKLAQPLWELYELIKVCIYILMVDVTGHTIYRRPWQCDRVAKAIIEKTWISRKLWVWIAWNLFRN